MATDDQSKQDKAREALAGPAWSGVKKVTATEADLEKKRALARASMEGYERRSQREQAAMRARAEAETKAKVEASLAAKRELAEKAEEAKRIAEQELALKQAADKKAKLSRVSQANKIIEEIKKSPQANVTSIRTYQTDLSEAAQTGIDSSKPLNVNSYSRIIFSNDQPKSKRQGLMIIGIIILILASLGLIFGSWYFFFRQPLAAVPATIAAKALLRAENETEIYLTNKSAFELRGEVGSKIREAARDFAFAEAGGGPILNLYPTEATKLNEKTGQAEAKTQVGLTRFLAALDLNLPTSFKVALADDFMLGIYQAPEPALFYVLTVRSYETAAANLLTDAGQVIDILFSAFLNSQETARRLRDQNFIDQIIENVDARVITNEGGKVVMVYGFLDQKTLAIASSQEAFQKLISSFRTPLPVSR